MTFDISTLIAINMIVHIALGLSMLLYWRTQKTYPGFGYWTASYGISAVLFLTIVLTTSFPVVLSIVLVNFLSMATVVVRYEGVRRFWGAGEIQKRNIFLVLVLLLPIGYFTGIHDDPLIRMVIFSSCLTYYACAMAYQLIKNCTFANKYISWAIAALHLVYCIILDARAVAWFLDPTIRDRVAPVSINITYYAANLILEILVVIGFLILNSQRLEEELQRSRQELEGLAAFDSLAEVYNRRKILELGEIEIIRSRRFQHSFAVLMFDIDYFKEINDKYGHQAGDRVLLNITQVVKKQVREIDSIGRVGGDEFVVLFPEIGAQQAYPIAERIRLTLGKHRVEWEEQQIPVKVSIGVTELLEQDGSMEDLLKRADYCLYQAKQSGRNKVIVG